jgi:hypothetical protein
MFGNKASHSSFGLGNKNTVGPSSLGNRKSRFSKKFFQPIRCDAGLDNKAGEPNLPVNLNVDKRQMKSSLEKR